MQSQEKKKLHVATALATVYAFANSYKKFFLKGMFLKKGVYFTRELADLLNNVLGLFILFIQL